MTRSSLWLLLFLCWSVKLVRSKNSSSIPPLRLRQLPVETIRKDTDRDDVDAFVNNTVSTHRFLVGAHNGFRPLNCNRKPCAEGTSTWTVEGYDPMKGVVVIPCGKCITMDYKESSTLNFPHGLDVQGTLVFPDGYELEIIAPFVRVQGRLDMKATRVVTDKPSIRIVLTGENERTTAFRPARNNRWACTLNKGVERPSFCQVGSKAIVVAGGQLDIQGLPQTCKTWVNLQRLASPFVNTTRASSVARTPEKYNKDYESPHCSSNIYINDSFDIGGSHSWTGGYGARYKVAEPGYLKVFDRESSTEHGPTYDLKPFQDCLAPNQEYIFSCRIRLVAPNKSGPTECAEKGSSCLLLKSLVRFSSSQIGRVKGQETTKDAFEYNKWIPFYSTFSFTSEEIPIDRTVVFHLLRFEGIAKDVDIEIDNVHLSVPHRDLSSRSCSSNLIPNGNAEANSIHPYPITGSRGSRLTVVTNKNGNSFFRSDLRESSADSMVYNMNDPSCMMPGASYRVSARIRVRSPIPVKSIMAFRAFFSTTRSTLRFVMAECGPNRGNFVSCAQDFVLPKDLVDVKSLQFYFETQGGSRRTLEVDNWKLQLVEGSTSSILLQEDGVSNCWGRGSEILITSHTTDFKASQVRRLVSSPEKVGNGLVRLDLDDVITPSVTLEDGDGFAVEVALLSRNIVFQGQPGGNDSLLGGHLIVMNTPEVIQSIDGVELRNFGRQGELGRYPIHFHMCENVDGSVVSRNSIRFSNQRCVVVHGTHNLTVADNVAHETKGHCYMTEDGGELDNMFLRNLGASTRAAQRLVRPFESDANNPSTFWCSNPRNEWIGNVAAGSESNGFWFELPNEVRPPTSYLPSSRGMIPRRLPLKLFIDNVSHSNWKSGLRTYPFGFFPPNQATFDNTRSYKNRMEGIFVHQSHNLLFRGGVVADNAIQADFDRADQIMVEGMHVIGISNRYAEIASTQTNTPALPATVVGLELHSFTVDTTRSGASIENVQFSGFSNHPLVRSNALIQIDDDKWTGSFDYWTTLKGISIIGRSASALFDFKKAESNGISNIYITDIDSSMKPPGVSASGTSSVLSDSKEMVAFVDVDQCERFPSSNFLYCGGTCFRTITLAVDPAGSEDVELFVSDIQEPSKSFTFSSSFHYETLGKKEEELDIQKNTDLRKRRHFAPALPRGSYTMEFRGKRSGSAVWPTFAEITFETAQCENALGVEDVDLKVPVPEQCEELIRNGDFEKSLVSAEPWLHLDNTVSFLAGKGINGSNAISDVSGDSPKGRMGQYIDVRCLKAGLHYDVRVWVYLERSGSPFKCDSTNCPRIKIRGRKSSSPDGTNFSVFEETLASSFVVPYNTNGWNLLQGLYTVDSTVSLATSVALTVERGLANVRMFIDNVSMTPASASCTELVLNGNFSEGSSIFWQKEGSATSKLEMVTLSGKQSLKMRRRVSSGDSPAQKIRTGCMIQGNGYIATASFRLETSSGSPLFCNPNSRSGQRQCPRLRLRSFTGSRQTGGPIAETDHSFDGAWQTLSGVFFASEVDETSVKSMVSIVDAPKGLDLIIDSVSITPLVSSCSEICLNGDAEMGNTARFWRSVGSGGTTQIDIVRKDGSNAFKISNRKATGDGISQQIDPKCLESSTTMTFKAKMHLISNLTGNAVACDPKDSSVAFSCPRVFLHGYLGGSLLVEEKVSISNSVTWRASLMNEYMAEFQVSAMLASCDSVTVSIRSYNLDWDMVIDDISLSRP